jgi:hypothetical protein
MTQFAYAPQTVILPNRRVSDAIRYGGVMMVWLGLTAVQPSLGMEIYRNRRPDSPLRRRISPEIPRQFVRTPAPQAF